MMVATTSASSPQAWLNARPGRCRPFAQFSWDVSFFFATDLSEELVNVLYYSDFAHRISFPSYYLADR